MVNEIDDKCYLTRKTLGPLSLEPYRILGVLIKTRMIETNTEINILTEKTKWDWQTIRRIIIGDRRTDFVELIILASILSSDKIEFNQIILAWAEEVYDFIHQDTLLK